MSRYEDFVKTNNIWTFVPSDRDPTGFVFSLEHLQHAVAGKVLPPY